jgi:hypothetical protein
MMPSPAVTLCRRSFHGGKYRVALTRYTCDNPIAPCSVRTVAHKGHNWLAPAGWRHCNGVSPLRERPVGT